MKRTVLELKRSSLATRWVPAAIRGAATVTTGMLPRTALEPGRTWWEGYSGMGVWLGMVALGCSSGALADGAQGDASTDGIKGKSKDKGKGKGKDKDKGKANGKGSIVSHIHMDVHSRVRYPPKDWEEPRRGLFHDVDTSELVKEETAGGHSELYSTEDKVYKVVRHPVLGEAERMFNEAVFGPHVGMEEPYQVALQALRELSPVFYGTVKLRRKDGSVHECLVYENLLKKYKKPCILDIKLGARRWAFYATDEKIRRREGKHTFQRHVGYRYSGMRVWRPHGGEDGKGAYARYDKSFGASLDVKCMPRGLHEFLYDGKQYRVDLIPKFQAEILKSLDWYLKQRALHTYATSLLLIYDAEDIEAPVTVRMIDYAHVWRSNGDPDHANTLGILAVLKDLQSVALNTPPGPPGPPTQ